VTDLVTENPLSLNVLVESLKEVMRAAPDKRTGKNCVYSMEDAALAAFAIFHAYPVGCQSGVLALNLVDGSQRLPDIAPRIPGSIPG
jgi:hypothetical protein